MDDRQNILSAATKVVADVGFQMTELADVALEAGVQEASVKALFPDKTSLLRAALKNEIEPVTSAVGLAIDGVTDARALMSRSLRVFEEWVDYHPDAMRVWMRCAIEQPSEAEGIFEQSLFPSEFYERLQQLIDDGSVRCRDILILTMLIESLILFPHMMRPAMERAVHDVDLNDVLQRRFEAVLDLLENGLYSNPGGPPDETCGSGEGGKI